MTITHRSAKAKGNRLQNEVRDKLRIIYTSLEDDDIVCAFGSQTGCDLKLSPAALKYIPYSFECKNTEKLQIWAALEQAEANTKPKTEPVVVFKRNRSKTYAVIELDTFLKLIQK